MYEVPQQAVSALLNSHTDQHTNCDILTSSAGTEGNCSDLRSSLTSAYLLPQLKTKFGERAFSYASLSTQNALTSNVRDVPNSDSFRQLLKTYSFSLAFNTH